MFWKNFVYTSLISLLYNSAITHSQLETSSPSSSPASSSSSLSSSSSTTLPPQRNVTCICDPSSTKSNNQGMCTLTLDPNNDAIAYNGVCECTYSEPFYYQFSSSLDLYTVSCISGSTTSTTTTTPIPGQTTDSNGNGEITDVPPEEEIIYKGSCNTTALENDKRKITKILTYVASIWVIIWTVATFITNIACKEFGHHRFIGILEEIAIIILFIFMGFFAWDPFDNYDYCKITTIILQFLMVLILGCCLFEAVFARSLIKGSSIKNGIIPAFLNYILPFVFAAIPTALTYWQLKEFYASTGVHCFVATYTDMLWAFLMPNWILLILIFVIGQLAFLACEQADREMVDLKQYFWSKKICKSMPIFSTWILSTYFLLFFAFDQQKFWLFCVYLALCIFLGPLIFICHTFCYQNTATKLWDKTHFPVYTPCPVPSPPPTPRELEKRPLTPEELKPTAPISKEPQNYNNNNNPRVNPYSNPGNNNLLPPQPIQPNRSPISNDPTSSQDFYNWVTDKNPTNIRESENVLFRRK